MTVRCAVCGTELSRVASLFGKRTCRVCRAAAVRNYNTLLVALVEHRADPVLAGGRLSTLGVQAGFDMDTQRRFNLDAFKRLMTTVLERHACLSEMDERNLKIDKIMQALDLDAATLSNADGMMELLSKWQVAMANAGRLVTLQNPGIFLKEGEIAYLVVGAELLKEIRHTVRNYGGLSVRLAKGMYAHVGQSVPHVSSSIEVVDYGTLTVTSHRIVYTGAGQSLEIIYNKLLALNVFTNGIQFHQSNRANAPLFRLNSKNHMIAHVVAATINAAVQRHI
jgi:hypothetical protein